MKVLTKSVMSIDVPAEPSCLKCIRGFLKPVFDARFDDDEVQSLVLAVDEACSNIIKHGQHWFLPRGRIALELVDGKKSIEIRILNFCGAKDVEKIKPRDLDDIKPGGLGTHFISEIMDSVDFVPDKKRDGRMKLVMIKETTGGKS